MRGLMSRMLRRSVVFVIGLMSIQMVLGQAISRSQVPFEEDPAMKLKPILSNKELQTKDRGRLEKAIKEAGGKRLRPLIPELVELLEYRYLDVNPAVEIHLMTPESEYPAVWA